MSSHTTYTPAGYEPLVWTEIGEITDLSGVFEWEYVDWFMTGIAVAWNIAVLEYYLTFCEETI